MEQEAVEGRREWIVTDERLDFLIGSVGNELLAGKRTIEIHALDLYVIFREAKAARRKRAQKDRKRRPKR